MKITKQLFPDYSIVRHTHYGRILDYAQVGFISLTVNDIAALLNGKILDVEVGDTPTLIRFQQYEPDEPYDNNWGIFGKQSFRLSRCANKVDVIVTDSPLPLSIQYNQNNISRDNFNKYVLDIFNSYENKNYYLTRVKEYSGNGRFQTEDESTQIGKEIIKILNDSNIEYRYVNGDESNYRFIADEIIKLVKTRKE